MDCVALRDSSAPCSAHACTLENVWAVWGHAWMNGFAYLAARADGDEGNTSSGASSRAPKYLKTSHGLGVCDPHPLVQVPAATLRRLACPIRPDEEPELEEIIWACLPKIVRDIWTQSPHPPPQRLTPAAGAARAPPLPLCHAPLVKAAQPGWILSGRLVLEL